MLIVFLFFVQEKQITYQNVKVFFVVALRLGPFPYLFVQL